MAVWPQVGDDAATAQFNDEQYNISVIESQAPESTNE
jgi:hypothetical protein